MRNFGCMLLTLGILSNSLLEMKVRLHQRYNFPGENTSGKEEKVEKPKVLNKHFWDNGTASTVILM